MTSTRKRKSPTFRGIPIQYEPAIRVLHPKRKRKTGRVFLVNAPTRKRKSPSAKMLIAAAMKLRAWRLTPAADWCPISKKELILHVETGRYERSLARRKAAR